MCVSCETYEYTKSCGDRCEDHDFEKNEPWSDEYDTMLTCTRCGSCKMEEVA